MKRVPISFSALLLLTSHFSFAGSATWNLNSSSGDWNTAGNWTPATVPNGPNDTATFDVSNTTAISVSRDTEVNGIVYNSGASAFSTTAPSPFLLTFSGAGITNNSGLTQTIMATTHRSHSINAGIFFLNSATAGASTNFIVEGGAANDFPGAFVSFRDTSSAGDGFFTVNGGKVHGAQGGGISFEDDSTAANGRFVTSGAGESAGAVTVFYPASAGNGTFVANDGGHISVFNSIGDATFTINGDSHINGLARSNGSFLDGTVVGSATFTTNGGTASGAIGGYTSFGFTGGFDIGNSTIVVNGGVNGGEGGEVHLFDAAAAGSARVEIYGNGSCDISQHDAPGMSFGSLKGDGLVLLGANNLTIGRNNLSTAFSGVIQDDGSLTKIGTGTLRLSGVNIYTGGTTVSAGNLIINNTSGSGTGAGAVQVNAGTLGGKGIIAGAATIGTGSGGGAVLAPGAAAKDPTTLTIQSALTFKADGTYTYKLNTKKAKTDKVVVNGVTIESGAQFNFQAVANKKLTNGTVFTAISNTSANPISGTFANLPDNSTFTSGRNTYQADYQGGDGNDLALTVVP